jgi:hypothetical protein
MEMAEDVSGSRKVGGAAQLGWRPRADLLAQVACYFDVELRQIHCEGNRLFMSAEEVVNQKGDLGSLPAGSGVHSDTIGPIGSWSGLSSLYIRAHLLNHNVYGPGHSRNLTPLTRSPILARRQGPNAR